MDRQRGAGGSEDVNGLHLREKLRTICGKGARDMTFTAIPSPPFLATNDLSTELFPAVSECTVAQAAKILDMSEGCVNEYLDDGIIAFRLVNGKRLVQWDSLLEFEAEDREMKETMEDITRWAQEMGLYDD